MKRLTFIAPDKLEWEDATRPILQGPGEAIVRPMFMGRCDLDVLYLTGRMPLASGEPIGHEIIGRIVELGDKAAIKFKIGQTVIVPAQINCGTCSMCLAGQTGRCEAVPFGASYGMGRDGNYGGAVSDFIRVPFAEAMLVPLPEDIDYSNLTGLVDMASDAWRAIGPPLTIRKGASVLVMGGGTPVIGIYAAALAECLGASRVVYVDPSDRNRDAAARYAVDIAADLDAVPNPEFDIVVDAANDTNRFLQAAKACGPAAWLTSVAPPFTCPDIPMMSMYHRGITYNCSRPNCRHGLEPVLKAWMDQGFRPERIEPKIFKYEDAIEAWLDPALYVALERQ